MKKMTLWFPTGVMTGFKRRNQRPTCNWKFKTILNRIQHFAGFVYQEVRLRAPRGKLRIEVPN